MCSPKGPNLEARLNNTPPPLRPYQFAGELGWLELYELCVEGLSFHSPVVCYQVHSLGIQRCLARTLHCKVSIL